MTRTLPKKLHEDRLVTGSRDWLWRTPIQTALLDAEYWGREEGLILPGSYTFEITLAHGAARGADSIAAGMAAKWGWTTQPYRVTREQWARSRGAGYARNAEMVNDGADICLAFIKHDSNGATHCLRLAKKAGIPCKVYRLPVIIRRRRKPWNSRSPASTSRSIDSSSLGKSRTAPARV